MTGAPGYARAARMIGNETAKKKAKPKKTFVDWIKGRLVAMLVIGIGALGIQQFGPFADAVDAAGSVPTTAEIGQCFAADDTKRAVPCSGPRTYEVFAVVEFAARAPHPGQVAAVVGNPVCDEMFAEYVLGAEVGAFDYAQVLPSTASWSAGNRRVPCAVHRGDGGLMVGDVGFNG